MGKSALESKLLDTCSQMVLGRPLDPACSGVISVEVSLNLHLLSLKAELILTGKRQRECFMEQCLQPSEAVTVTVITQTMTKKQCLTCSLGPDLRGPGKAGKHSFWI